MERKEERRLVTIHQIIIAVSDYVALIYEGNVLHVMSTTKVYTEISNTTLKIVSYQKPYEFIAYEEDEVRPRSAKIYFPHRDIETGGDFCVKNDYFLQGSGVINKPGLNLLYIDGKLKYKSIDEQRFNYKRVWKCPNICCQVHSVKMYGGSLCSMNCNFFDDSPYIKVVGGGTIILRSSREEFRFSQVILHIPCGGNIKTCNKVTADRVILYVQSETSRTKIEGFGFFYENE